jgi:hypothetical protein
MTVFILIASVCWRFSYFIQYSIIPVGIIFYLNRLISTRFYPICQQ